MKRILPLIFIFIYLFSLSACDDEGELRFYYPRAEYIYGTNDGVIASESREAPGHENDLTYLLTLYLEGPLDQQLTSPFPRGTAIVDYTYSDGTLDLTLSESFAGLGDLDHTIASASIAYTCFSLTDASQIVIKCASEDYGNRTITFNRDSLILEDNALSLPTTTEP